jgi:hypothetical protein
MLLRREYKYLAPVGILDNLRSAIMPYVEIDKYAEMRPNKEYCVRSIYYDNSKLDAYYEKVEGIKIRNKVRIRCYNEPNGKNIAFLEIKRRLENFIDKHRSPLKYEYLEDLFYTTDIESYIIQKEPDALDNAKRFFFQINKNYMKPISLVVYDREAFFSRFDSDIRITFDKNLRFYSFPELASIYDESILKRAMPKYFILEIKFYKGFSEHFQDIINRFGLIRLALSKYQMCIDAEDGITSPIKVKQFTFINPVWKKQIYCKEAV